MVLLIRHRRISPKQHAKYGRIRDFAEMMVKDYQGAIDMARYKLAGGKDPAMLRLTRDFIAAQYNEIAEMKTWHSKHPAAR